MVLKKKKKKYRDKIISWHFAPLLKFYKLIMTIIIITSYSNIIIKFKFLACIINCSERAVGIADVVPQN